jgi:hypothetical protein
MVLQDLGHVGEVDERALGPQRRLHLRRIYHLPAP